jgi:hypothetical protein
LSSPVMYPQPHPIHLPLAVTTGNTTPGQDEQVPPPPPITPPFPQSTHVPAPPHALYMTPLQGVVTTEGLLHQFLQVETRIHDL